MLTCKLLKIQPESAAIGTRSYALSITVHPDLHADGVRAHLEMEADHDFADGMLTEEKLGDVKDAIEDMELPSYPFRHLAAVEPLAAVYVFEG